MNRKIGVLFSYVLMIFEVLNTLILTPFMIRILGQSEFGVYKLIVAINGYLLLLDLGIGNATVKYISKFRINNNKENERKFLGIVILYYCVIAILTLILGFILTYIFPFVFSKGLSIVEISLGQKLIFITMVSSAITLGTSAFYNVLIAYEKFSITKGFQILVIIFRLVFSFLILCLGYGSLGIVILNLIFTIFSRSFYTLYVLFKIKLIPIFKGFDKKLIKDVIFYSSWILLQMIATQFNASLDQILLGSLVLNSSLILAIYGIGSQICQYFQQIGSVFNGVLMPGIVKFIEKKPSAFQIRKEMVRLGRYMFMVLILIFGVFLVEGKEFIYLWAGKENISAYYVAIILMSIYLFVLSKSVATQILWALNEHKEQAILKFVVVILNIFISIILIKINPLLGATIGTFISILIGDVIVMDFVLYKKLKIDIFKYYLELFKGILPSILITVVFGILINNFFSGYSILFFCLKSFIMVLIYTICMYLFGINDDEKKLIHSILFSIVNKFKILK